MAGRTVTRADLYAAAYQVAGASVREAESGDTILSDDLLRWLGERRDGLLVVIAAVYGLGYITWSYTAWRNGLGQLPALEFQYILAGVVPAMILLSTFAAAKWFPDIQVAYSTKKPLWVSAVWYILFSIMLYQLATNACSVLVALGHLDSRWTTRLPSLPGSIFNVVILVGGSLAMLIENKALPGMWWPIYRFFIASQLSYVLLAMYVGQYGSLPQVLGGPAPRCAYIDIVVSEISATSLNVFADIASRTGSQPGIVRSVRLFVYFAGSEYILIRKAAESGKSETLIEEPLYELRREAIRVIEWCDGKS